MFNFDDEYAQFCKKEKKKYKSGLLWGLFVFICILTAFLKG